MQDYGEGLVPDPEGAPESLARKKDRPHHLCAGMPMERAPWGGSQALAMFWLWGHMEM